MSASSSDEMNALDRFIQFNYDVGFLNPKLEYNARGIWVPDPQDSH